MCTHPIACRCPSCVAPSCATKAPGHVHQFDKGETVYLPVDARVWTVVHQEGPMVTLQTRVQGGPVSTARPWLAVSYKPWPAAVHERPLVDGWYVVRNNLGMLVVYQRDAGQWRSQRSSSNSPQPVEKVIRFLGPAPE